MRVHNSHAAPTPMFGTEPSEGDICACRMTHENKTFYVAFRKGSWLEQDPVDLYQAYGVVRMECSVYQDKKNLTQICISSAFLNSFMIPMTSKRLDECFQPKTRFLQPSPLLHKLKLTSGISHLVPDCHITFTSNHDPHANHPDVERFTCFDSERRLLARSVPQARQRNCTTTDP